ncbi:MAG: flagellar M-ring protein FliF [Lentisphaerae bacterium RIFOXYB12_FULL_65_16]|nr:MAG: flagellar M-ring protein FliF [Lentisphaerae bacterium RIFOXYA12_64_32]OGV92033.1 MAG: flagellar M-ring protein FliF [Lentisphaerae bacterium RIFOXYB12_FULL_65_16]
MNGLIENFLYVCGEIWKSIGLTQRVSIIMIGLLGAAALAVLIYLGTRPNWQVLYSRLDSDTAAEVYALVRDENVPVRLRDSGTTILVPFEKVNDLRLKAAKAGIRVQDKGSGWELFDNVKIGLTEMQQRVGYQRALQGEIRRMIREIPGVEDAKVVVVLPQRRVFRAGENVRPKASVLLATKPGSDMSPSQVAGIRNLVASAVEGMEMGDVTVTDRNGRLLARAAGADSATAADPGSQMEIREQIEVSLREKAEAILRPFTGDDAVVAMVTADLDFSGEERQVETYDSEKSVVLSEKVITEENAKTGKTAGGVTGISSNVVSVRNPEGSAAGGEVNSQNRKTMENQYAVPKTTERISIHGPRIRSLSVAVTIARAAAGKARSAEEIEGFRRLVASAVGASIAVESVRKDMVTVVEQELRLPTMPPAETGAFTVADRVMELIQKYSALPALRSVLGILLLAVLYYLFGTAFRRDQVERYDLHRGAAAAADIYNVTADRVDDTSLGGVKRPADMIAAKVESDPSLVAGVMQTWISNTK